MPASGAVPRPPGLPHAPAVPRPPATGRATARARRAASAWTGVVLALLTAAGAAGGPPVAAATVAAPTPAPVAYRAPVTVAVRVLRPFAAPAQPWAAGHRGVDLEAGVGAAVVAPAGGTVAVAGRVVDRGVVTVVHADGRRSSLEPLTPGVVVGQRVAQGEALGTVSDERTHCATTCLHWGVREPQGYLDPLTLLPGGGPVVLLPDGG